jgi:hypothetical protein
MPVRMLPGLSPSAQPLRTTADQLISAIIQQAPLPASTVLLTSGRMGFKISGHVQLGKADGVRIVLDIDLIDRAPLAD